MHTLAEYVGASRSYEGDLIVSFRIDDQDLESMDGTLVLDVSKYSPKRSLNANAYFWKLCTEIARVLGSDKDTVYLMQLSKYGVYVDVEVTKEAAPALKDKFRYVEDLSDGFDLGDEITMRCYFGSSHYTKAEMSVLISGTVNDCHDLGINTWSQEEIDNLIKNWKGDK